MKPCFHLLWYPWPMNVATITDQLDTRWTWRSWAELVGQHPRLPMALLGLMPQPEDDTEAMARARAVHRWFRDSGLKDDADWMDPGFFQRLTGLRAWNPADGQNPLDAREEHWYRRLLDAERQWFSRDPLASVITGVMRMEDAQGTQWVVHWDAMEGFLELPPEKRNDSEAVGTFLRHHRDTIDAPPDWHVLPSTNLLFCAPSGQRMSARLHTWMNDALPEPVARPKARL